MKRIVSLLTVTLAAAIGPYQAFAQKDTLRVMAYNVLYYGSNCQGPAGSYHAYLSTIVKYTNPDILSLEKMAAIPTGPGDKYGVAPPGFADSVVRYALDAAFAGRYAHTPFSNKARTNNMSVVFYDQHKLGFLSVVSTYVNVTDFNTFKFYYKDPSLERTHDTTFLYVLPNHDLSGDENEAVRGVQLAGVLSNLKQHFVRLPNVIELGDFNVRGSREPFYQQFVSPADSGFRFFDPPFFPDRKLTYPATWDHDAAYAEYFTTSTRESANVPNSCGTGGGGKNWYDHIFLSSWIVNNTSHIRYIPGSYRTIGNDGQRFKVSINNANGHVNTSAPAEVIEALYQMSNKYPVMVTLEVTRNPDGKSPANPEIAGAKDLQPEPVHITTGSADNLDITFPADVIGQEVTIEVRDAAHETVFKKTRSIKKSTVSLHCKLQPGSYTVKVTGHHNIIAEQEVTK